MSKNSATLDNLQQALAMELTAVNQYLLHAHVLDDWGLDLMADKMREEVDEELEHAGAFIDRILFLGGTPKMAPAKTPKQPDTLKALFEADRSEEKASIAFYTKAARQAFEEDDIGSRRLFERITVDEEEHWEWLELQLELLRKMGEPAYMAINMRKEAG